VHRVRVYKLEHTSGARRKIEMDKKISQYLTAIKDEIKRWTFTWTENKTCMCAMF